jgi:hypothetical protein
MRSGQAHLAVGGEQAKVSGGGEQVDPRSSQTCLDELAHQLRAEVIHLHARNRLILHRVCRPLPHEPKQLISDQRPIGRAGAHQEAAITRLDPAARQGSDMDACHIVVVDDPALHLDLKRRLGRTGRVLDLLHQVLAPVDAQNLTGPSVADPNENRAAPGVGEGDHLSGIDGHLQERKCRVKLCSTFPVDA